MEGKIVPAILPQINFSTLYSPAIPSLLGEHVSGLCMTHHQTSEFIIGPWRTYYQSMEDMSQVLCGHIISPWRICRRSLENILSVYVGYVVGPVRTYYQSIEDMS